MPHKDYATRLAYQKAYRDTPAQRLRRAEDRHLWDSSKHANEHAAHYQRPGIIRTKDVRFIYERDGHCCHYCGKPASKWFGLDHVIALANGGDNTVENIVLSCHSCNASKWRSATPGRWSRYGSACRSCGTSARKHTSKGFCGACYQRQSGVYERRIRKTTRRVSLEARMAIHAKNEAAK